jgi:hypothetical protein
MEYLLIGVVAYFLYMKYFKGDGRSTNTTLSKKENNDFDKKDLELEQWMIELEAKEIAKKIKTRKGLEALEEKLYKLQEKSDEYDYNDNEVMREKTDKKISIIESAICIAGDNPFRYYFCDDVDMETPQSVIRTIGKSISPSKYEEINDEDKNYFDVITLEEVENIEEANEMAKEYFTDEAKEVIKLRKIFDSDMDSILKEQKFDALVSKSEYLQEILDFDEDIDEDISFYQQYLADRDMRSKIKEFGNFTFAEIFVHQGYENIEEVQKLSDKEILSIKGVGKKTLETIRAL